MRTGRCRLHAVFALALCACGGGGSGVRDAAADAEHGPDATEEALEAGALDEADAGQAYADAARPEPWQPRFRSNALTRSFYAEGAAVADIDGDGVLDLVGGPYWYRGPDYQRGGQLHAQAPIAIEQLSGHFLDFTDDLNGDGAQDVIAVGFPGEAARWYENPGAAGLARDWTAHTLHPTVGGESPLYVDVTGDARRELVFFSQGRLGYAQPAADVHALWTFHAVSPDLGFGIFTHGLGAGDIDGDGRIDLIEASGWWRQPEDARREWTRHPVDFSLGGGGGAQMPVFDVDGDGDRDVVTSLRAHGYGLAWFEQKRSGDAIGFEAHVILPLDATPDNVSQLHALASADLNGDGLMDVVTGKRFYAHPPPVDPGGTDPALLLWFELQRTPEGARFVRHQVHDDSGVGCGFALADVNGDGRVDVFVSNKKGSFVHLQE